MAHLEGNLRVTLFSSPMTEYTNTLRKTTKYIKSMLELAKIWGETDLLVRKQLSVWMEAREALSEEQPVRLSSLLVVQNHVIPVSSVQSNPFDSMQHWTSSHTDTQLKQATSPSKLM